MPGRRPRALPWSPSGPCLSPPSGTPRVPFHPRFGPPLLTRPQAGQADAERWPAAPGTGSLVTATASDSSGFLRLSGSFGFSFAQSKQAWTGIGRGIPDAVLRTRPTADDASLMRRADANPGRSAAKMRRGVAQIPCRNPLALHRAISTLSSGKMSGARAQLGTEDDAARIAIAQLDRGGAVAEIVVPETAGAGFLAHHGDGFRRIPAALGFLRLFAQHRGTRSGSEGGVGNAALTVFA
jgi:hypothetical protein